MNLLSLVDQLREWLVTFNQHGSMSGNPDQSRVDAYEHAWNSIEALCGIADKLEGLVEAPELFEQLVVERWSIYHALPTLQKISNTGMIDTTTTAENNREVMVLLCKASGRSTITENIFENRFMHVAELRRLGAKITIKEKKAIIEGNTEFLAAELMSSDLRASVALVLAAIVAKGQTVINRIYHLDRGYELSLIHI